MKARSNLDERLAKLEGQGTVEKGAAEPGVDFSAIVDDTEGTLNRFAERLLGEVDKRLAQNPALRGLHAAQTMNQIAEGSPSLQRLLKNPQVAARLRAAQTDPAAQKVYESNDVNRNKAMHLDIMRESADRNAQAAQQAEQVKLLQHQKENAGAFSVSPDAGVKPTRQVAKKDLSDLSDEEFGKVMAHVLKNVKQSETERGL